MTDLPELSRRPALANTSAIAKTLVMPAIIIIPAMVSIVAVTSMPTVISNSAVSHAGIIWLRARSGDHRQPAIIQQANARGGRGACGSYGFPSPGPGRGCPSAAFLRFNVE